MKVKLTQIQRLIVAFIYIALIAILYSVLNGNLFEIEADTSIWFYSGALLLIIGTYLIEPFFTKPTDTITNTISAFLALFVIKDKNAFFAFDYIFYFVIGMFLLSIITIFIKDRDNRISKLFYWIVKNFGSSKFIFSLIYLSSAYSYFAQSITLLITSFTFWILELV